MTGYLWAVIGLLAALAMTAFGDMASEEVRDRLDHLPHAILRLAARRLDPSQRVTIYHDEWLPELTYVLKGAEARPITRLVTGTRFALGILVASQRITRHLHRTPPPLAPTPADTTSPPQANRYDAPVLGTVIRLHRSSLTPKEVEIANLISSGKSTRETAESLGVAMNTVRYHLRVIYKKLEVRTRTELRDQLPHLD